MGAGAVTDTTRPSPVCDSASDQPCPDCGATGLTGEQVYERISNEGGIWLDVLCPTCQTVEDGEAVLHAE